MKKPFSETPAGYVVSGVVGALTGGPIGLFLSPLCLLAVNKSIEAPEKVTPQEPSKRWITWAGIGIIAGPMSYVGFALLQPDKPAQVAVSSSAPSVSPSTPSVQSPSVVPSPAAPAVASTPKSLPFRPSVAPPRPNTDNPILIKRWEKRVAEVKIENDPEAMNRPRNGGTTTLAQKCDALDAGGDLSDTFSLGFQIGFEHEYGSLSADEACRRVRLMGLK